MKAIRLPLYVGAAYFLLVALVHTIGFKLPGFFIYFNMPSYHYQDQVIGLLAFGWAVFFFTTAKTLAMAQIKSILLIGLTALLMLTYINLTIDNELLPNDISTAIYHAEVGLLAIYWLWLLWGYLNFKKEQNL
jgi:hypothetical protein